jgi:small subunit ribosomal protein S9
MEMINAVGRRKASVARVYVTEGEGRIFVNGKEYKEYFPQIHIQQNIDAPFKAANLAGSYNVKVNVKGGGFKGQAEAIRMAISKALVVIDSEVRKPLKDMKFLKRDAREVERKKFGKPKARKSFQFSKR